MTVTPPAAAAREAQPRPSWLAWLPECTWPSTTPGMIHCPLASTLSRAAGGAPMPRAAILPSRTASQPFSTIPCGSTILPRTTQSKSLMTPSIQ